MRKNLFLIALALFCFAAGCSTTRSGDYVPGEMLVSFKSGALSETGDFMAYSLTKLNESFNLKSKERISGNLYLLRFPTDTDMQKALDDYKQNPLVEHAELNHKVRAGERR